MFNKYEQSKIPYTSKLLIKKKEKKSNDIFLNRFN